MAEVRAGEVRVVTPATSANLGPGFDALGLALAWYDEVAAETTRRGLDIEVGGEGAADVPRDDGHLVVRSMRATFDLLGVAQPGLRLTCHNRIPQGRGLGSSSAAIVAGIRLAEELTSGAALTSAQRLVLANDLEGHPDNVAACVLGGLTIAWLEDGDDGEPLNTSSRATDTSSRATARAVRLDVHPDIHPVVFVPPEPLPTQVARGLLPRKVSHRDASRNAGRAALLVAALTRRPDHLLAATEDWLHQEYRAPAMPDSLHLVSRLRSTGVATVLSGAGPTVLALGTSTRPVDIRQCTPEGWHARRLAIDGNGTRLAAETRR
ncbi:MAG: homoserine kinase [Nocardioidaceae bacterium]